MEAIDANNRLGTWPVGKLLFNLAMPSITAQVINALYNMVDRMYIRRIPVDGSLAIAGLGVAFPLIMIISAFASLIGMGGASRAAIRMGEGNNTEAEKILNNSFIALVLISIALTVFFYLTKTQLLTLFGATENMLPFADSYFSVYLIGTLFVQLSLGLNQFISAQGFARTSMMTVVIGALMNIVLDPIFIYGFGMGVKGAALATIISQMVSAIWVMMFLCGKRSIIRINKRFFKLDKNVIAPILALGISPFIMQSTESLVQLALNSGMKAYGGANADQYVGIITILVGIMQFVLMPMIGLTQGAQPIISYNYGAGKTDRVRKTFKLLMISSLVYSVSLWMVCMIWPQALIRMFSNDAAYLEIGKYGMRIFIAGFFIIGAQFACQNTLVALGQAKISTFLALLRKVILLIPLAIVLPRFFGTTGIFVAEPVADIIASVTTSIVFVSYFRKVLRHREEETFQHVQVEDLV